MSLFSVSKEISDLIHDADTDYDAQVKIVIPGVDGGDEREFTVTDVNYEVNLEDGQATVWLSVVEE